MQVIGKAMRGAPPNVQKNSLAALAAKLGGGARRPEGNVVTLSTRGVRGSSGCTEQNRAIERLPSFRWNVR
jgi:hypothetical protein